MSRFELKKIHLREIKVFCSIQENAGIKINLFQVKCRGAYALLNGIVVVMKSGENGKKGENNEKLKKVVKNGWKY